MRTPITQKGYDALKAELERILKVDRPQNIRDIAEAREHGDLKENAEYKAAKEYQGLLDVRMNDLKLKLETAQIIEIGTGAADTVVFGVTVRVKDTASEEENTYMLVGQEEADVASGSISVQSPIGRALIGHHVGDLVPVKRPAGMIEYEIMDISFQG